MIHHEEQEIELNASFVGGPEWILAKISLLNDDRKDSIVYAIFFEDTTERHRMLESLQYYATRDDLTGSSIVDISMKQLSWHRSEHNQRY